MTIRDYQRSRVFAAQANASGVTSRPLTASQRLRHATKAVNTRWWQANSIRPNGMMLMGTGCEAIVAGTHPLATHPPVRHGEAVTIIVPETTATDLDVYHALAHIVPSQWLALVVDSDGEVSADVTAEALHGPRFCRHMLQITYNASESLGERLRLAMDHGRVQTESISIEKAANKLEQARRRQESQRETTIASLVEKLNRLKE